MALTTDADLYGMFPWLSILGITPAQVHDWVVNLASPDAILEALRKTPQYQARFPAIRRMDGTLVSTEAQYLNTEANYRQILRQNGRPDQAYDNPADFIAFFNNEIDPNELQQRFQTYNQLDRAGQDTKDAFYVYAGMKLTTDDLYQATVSPEFAQTMTDEYNQRVAAQPLDYQTWITRATEAGLSRVAGTLTTLQNNGAVTGEAVSQVLSTDPGFARTMMDALFHGGDPNTNRTLNLTELMNSFEYAMVGSAATGQGLELPSLERIRAIRQAGIDRTKALDAYSQFAQNKNLLAGMVDRLNEGAGTFGQNEFEKAVMLRSAPEAQLLAQAQAKEQAAGARSGEAGFSLGANGQLQQRGLTSAFNPG